MNEISITSKRVKALSNISSLINTDTLIPEDIRFRTRYYANLAFYAAWTLYEKTSLSNHSKAVRALSAQGHELGKWPTMKAAGIAMECDPHSIYKSIKRGSSLQWSKKAGNKVRGITWEIIKDDEL